ncbi:MAG: type 1 periplasmic binding fold superfamily protein [Flavobacteriales bacterium]
MRFTDVDGAGGNAPVYLIDSLDASTSYIVETILLNETTTPVDTISNEVRDEGTAHQFFYTVSGLDLSVAYGDTDANGRPIGLLTTMSSGTAGSGTLLVTLRHEPDKSAAGVAAGDITNAGGETDVEVSFPLVVRE